MRRQKCSQCGTMLDVSDMEKASKFACSNCGTILVAGETKVTKRSLKGSGPAFQRKAKADAPEGPAPTRSRRARAPAPASDAGGKSKLPLFVGIGAVVVIGVVAAVFMGGDGGGSGGAGGTGIGGGGGRGSGAGQWWADKATQLALADADTLRSWLKEAKEKGYDQDSGFWAVKEHDIYKALLKKDPADTAANRYAGRKNLAEAENFKQMWDAMNANYTALPEGVKAFADRYAARVDAGRGVWMTEAEHVEAMAAVETFRAWHAERKANPAAPRIEKGIRDAKAILKGYEFESATGGPFILLLGFDAKGGEGLEQKKEELREAGKKFAKAVEVVHAEFDKRIREPLGLHEVPKDRYFIQVCLGNQTEFAKFLRSGEGYDVAGDVLGFFSPRTRWAGVVTTRDAEGAKDIGGDLGHEAVHQLQYYYSKDPKKKFSPNFFDEWTGIWLSEGLAEFIGGGIKLDATSGEASWTPFPRRRIEFLQGMRDNGVPLIDLREIVQLASLEAWQRYVGNTWIPGMREDEDMPEAAVRWLGEQPGVTAKLMYAHCWFLAYFMNEYENGKYAAQYRDLVMTALRGKQKPEKYRKRTDVLERWGSAYDAFKDIMGLKDDGGWKTLDREFEKFLPKTLRKAK